MYARQGTRSVQRVLCLMFIMTIIVGRAVQGADDGSIDFNRDVRPLFSNHCFKCHGPDEEQREADLRLDTRQGALSTLR